MSIQGLAPFLMVIEIILSVILVVMVTLQAKGSDISAITGGDAGSYRTKRGLEAALHRWTIVTSIAFFVMTFITFLAMGQL